MDKSLRVSIGDYLAGASITFAIVLLADQIFSIIYGTSILARVGLTFDETMLTTVGLHTASGFVGGYMIGRRDVKKSIQAALVIAVVAYVFESLYITLFIGPYGDIWSLISLVIGGLLGSTLAKVQLAKRALVVKEIK